MTKMSPPIKDLLPRLTPILKNRHEKVQENCIELVGRIADRGAEFVSAREWMRICFELLELLKAHKKAIRRAAINTFGYIAKAIGPSRRLGHSAQQSQSPRAPKPCLHDRGDRHSRRDLLAIHRPTRSHERVPCA